MGKINLQLAPPENFQNELEQKGMEDDGPLVFGCVFSGCFYSHYMPLCTIFRALYLNDSVHFVTRHVCRRRSE